MSKSNDNFKVSREKVIVKRKSGRGLDVRTVNPGESVCDQSFKDDCDVNFIVQKFMKTGQITHLAKHRATYSDVSEFGDTLEAMNVVAKAQQAFDALPSYLRDRFGNSPVNMVEFLQDPKNVDEAVKLGLMEVRDIPKTAPAPQEPGGDKPKARQSSKKQPELPLDEE